MTKLVHNIQKKQHRERSQPKERAKWNLLEKKKDYRLRAADFHKKEAAIKRLKEKAKNRNEDEYYHSMKRKKTDDRGILLADRGNESLSVDQVKLLKSQDVNYVRTMRLKERGKIEKHMKDTSFKSDGKHTVFVESQTDLQNFHPEVHFNTTKEMLANRENRIKIDQLLQQEGLVSVVGDLNKERQNIKKLKLLKLLKERVERENQLAAVESRIEDTRELMKKGNKKKVTNADGKTLFKWKNVRKR